MHSDEFIDELRRLDIQVDEIVNKLTNVRAAPVTTETQLEILDLQMLLKLKTEQIVSLKSACAAYRQVESLGK